MPSKNLIFRHIVLISTISISATLLLIGFSNCSPINSQAVLNISSSSGSFGIPNTPVNSNNPFVLQCITSSDGARVAKALISSVDTSAGISGSASKIDSLDWNQDLDLIVTIDNSCMITNEFSDPIMNYLDRTRIKNDLPETVYEIKKESVTQLHQFIKDVVASECVVSANKNYPIKLSADTYFSRQFHLLQGAPGTVPIGATQAVMDSVLSYVNNPTYMANNKKVKVAIIDSGVDTGNTDLINMIAKNANGSVRGYNTTTDAAAGFLTDSGYHGTHVAGLIAAEYNNNFGVSGVYGANVEIIPFRASTDGSSMQLSWIVNAINIAVNTEQVDIINMSLETESDLTEIRNALANAEAKGVTVVVAAGNGDETGIGRELGVYTYVDSTGVTRTFAAYPSMYSSRFSGLISVGSVDLKSNNISRFSNRSPTYVDVLAPGSNGDLSGASDNREGILSTIPRTYNSGVQVGSTIQISATQYSIIHGTSMATPLVTGSLASVLSMAKSRNVRVTHTELKQWISGTGSPKNMSYANFSKNGSYLNYPQLIAYATQQIESKMSGGQPSQNPNITISTQPLSRQVVLGERVELSVTASGTGTLNYQWYKNGNAITGATSRTYGINGVSQSDGALYRVQISNGSDMISSAAVDLKVALRYCN